MSAFLVLGEVVPFPHALDLRYDAAPRGRTVCDGLSCNFGRGGIHAQESNQSADNRRRRPGMRGRKDDRFPGYQRR